MSILKSAYVYHGVGVCLDGDIRLMDGPSEAEGRLEVCSGFQWYSVCDSGFDNRDAAVVCRMLGFSRYRELSLYGIIWYSLT